MHKGNKWARLECLDIEKAEIELKFEGVIETRVVSAFKIRCDCGNVLLVEKLAFKGKRLMRDCGCGIGQEQGKVIVMSFSTKEGVRDRLIKLAGVHGASLSWTINELLRVGLDMEGIEQNQSKAKESN